MSTLKADTIQSTGGGAATLTKQQAAKSWINFNATGTIATRDSFNISGIVDEKTGITTVSFTNNMQTDANYATLMGGHDIADSENFNGQHIFINRQTASNYVVQNNNSGGVATDWELNNAANFGDLA
tara:strand:+ start:193 stop:573 length:381 start_codon:yes stop_codon:yes gene_type:complete